MFVSETNGAKWEIIKRILNFQEQLLITVIEQDDKGEVRLGESEVESHEGLVVGEQAPELFNVGTRLLH